MEFAIYIKDFSYSKPCLTYCRHWFNILIIEILTKQEAIVYPPWVVLAIRPNPGVWEYVRINVDELMLDELSVSEYLAFKELLVNEQYVKIYLLKQIMSFRKLIYIKL